jgi:hypothetical protein
MAKQFRKIDPRRQSSGSPAKFRTATELIRFFFNFAPKYFKTNNIFTLQHCYILPVKTLTLAIFKPGSSLLLRRMQPG